MVFEWDDAKSARVKAERGASFEELTEAIDTDTLEIVTNPGNDTQRFFIVRHQKEIWVVVTERRGNRVRIVTAYPNRKLRRKYGI